MNVMGTPPNNYSVEQASTTKLAPNRGADLDFRVLADGSVTHNIAYPSTLDKKARGDIDSELKGLADKYSQLDDLIADAKAKGMDGLVKDLQTAKTDIEKKMQAVKDFIEKPIAHITAGGIGRGGDQMMVGTCKNMLDVKLDIDDAVRRIGSAAGGDAPEATKGSAGVEDMKGAGGVAGANEKGEDGELSEMGRKYVEMSDNQIMTQFSQNPEATWKEIASLPSDERSLIMQKLQMAVQQDNQLQSMLTNLLKAMHDTTKGTISNLRV